MADNNIITVTGMVISTMPVGETDRRIVLLTKERGKITAFAKGAKKPNSPLSASCQPFVFGEFEVYEGRTSYNIRNVNVKNYFRELVTDFYGAYYGFYFLELADYYGREGIDESVLITLLYQTFRALLNENIPNELIKVIYELKIMTINGEYPEMTVCTECGTDTDIAYYSDNNNGVCCKICGSRRGDCFTICDSTIYAMQYIIFSSIGKLYNFNVKREVLYEMRMIVNRFRSKYIDKKLKSLEILESLSNEKLG